MENLLDQATTTNDGADQQQETEATGGDQSQAAPEGEQQQQEPEQQQEQEPQGAPEKYELKAPEGQEFDGEFLKAYEETAKELNLTNEAAQKLIDKVSPVMQKQQMERIEAVRKEWTENSKADKEFGGDKLNENLVTAKAALDQFGTPELKQLLNDSGLGNHPEVIRLLYRAGKQISQDKFVGGQAPQGKNGPKSFNDFASALYS